MSQKNVQVRCLWLVGVIWKLHIKENMLTGVGRKPCAVPRLCHFTKDSFEINLWV